MSGLAKYEQARAALAVCVKVDEAKAIRNKAEALRAYAVQANDPELETWAAEIKLRALRRIGELSRELEKAKHGGKGGGVVIPPSGTTKAETLAAAGLSTQQASRCETIAAVPEEKFEAIIDAAKEGNRPVSSKEVIRLAAKEAKQESIASSFTASAERCCTVEDLAVITEKFGCIYADPPWGYSNQGTRAATRNHYPTMSVEEITALPIKNLAADRSHLWLWTTNAFIFECPRIFEAWGFEFKSSYVWVKNQIGIGNYLRNSHEFLLLATRGGLVGAAKDIRSWGLFDRTEHSAKPEKIRSEVVERASPGPRLELFGRKPVSGWTVWGNQIRKESLFDGEVRKLA